MERREKGSIWRNPKHRTTHFILTPSFPPSLSQPVIVQYFAVLASSPPPHTAPTTLMRALITSCLAYWISLLAGHIFFLKISRVSKLSLLFVASSTWSQPTSPFPPPLSSSHSVCARFTSSGASFVLLSVPLFWNALSQLTCEILPECLHPPAPPFNLFLL